MSALLGTSVLEFIEISLPPFQLGLPLWLMSNFLPNTSVFLMLSQLWLSFINKYPLSSLWQKQSYLYNMWWLRNLDDNLYCWSTRAVQLCRKVNSHCYRNSSLKAVPAFSERWAMVICGQGQIFFKCTLFWIYLMPVDEYIGWDPVLLYYLLAVLGLRYYTGFSLAAGSGSYCLVSVLGLLTAVVSLVVEHRLRQVWSWHMGIYAPLHAESSQTRDWTCVLHWQANSLPLRHLGSPEVLFLSHKEKYATILI